jgi:hypothetical protein
VVPESLDFLLDTAEKWWYGLEKKQTWVMAQKTVYDKKKAWEMPEKTSSLLTGYWGCIGGHGPVVGQFYCGTRIERPDSADQPGILPVADR